MIFIWSEANWNYDTFFYLNLLTLVKLSQLIEIFDWKWLSLVFYLLILPTKWQNWLLASAFAFYLPICMKFMQTCWMDIKILLAHQQDVCTYASNLISDVTLQVNVEGRLAKNIFQYVGALFWKRNLSIWVSCWMDTLEKVIWIFIFL